MSRFSIKLDEIADERVLVPIGAYPARITKADVRSGKTKEDKNWLMLNLTLTVRDEEVSKLLSQDEPKIFYSVGLRFNEDDSLSTNNPDFKSLLNMLDLSDKGDIFEAGTDEADDQWAFNLLYFKNVCEALVGYDVLANVVHKPKYNDPDTMVAEVNKLAKLDD